MPELPEVETIKTAIESSIGESSIENIFIYNKQLREKIPDDLIAVISCAKILKYERRAKYILFHLNNGYSLIMHLGMSGRIRIYAQSEPYQLQKHDHFVLETSGGTIVYNDARRFGLISYEKTKNINESKYFKNLGKEPFDKKLPDNFLFQQFKNKKCTVKVALLDQSILVGIGNIYACESLFEAQINPTRIASNLSEQECVTLLYKIRSVLHKAIQAGGSTLKDYQKPDGSLGYFQNMHCVYNKKGQPCPICQCDLKKTKGIQKIIQAGRSTFYCPVKQK